MASMHIVHHCCQHGQIGLRAVFPLNAKKVRICEIMSGGFAIIIQQCVKKVWRLLVTFSLC